MSRAIVLFLLVLVAPRGALAWTVKVCVKLDVAYIDAGYGEDYWTTRAPDITPQYARGAWATVVQSGQTKWNGNLGDGFGGTTIGCSPSFTASTGWHTVYVYSEGSVQGNAIEVHDDSDLSRTLQASLYVSASETYTLTISPPAGATFDVFNTYQASAYALYRHAGGLSETFAVNVVDSTPCSGGSFSSCNYGGEVYIYSGGASSPGGTDNKFMLVHELGHRLAAFATSKLSDGSDKGWAEGQNDCDAFPSGGVHSMRSAEHQGGALYEGFAHFYAADVWNNHGQTDCWFKYYQAIEEDDDPYFNCEVASTNFPVGYSEDVPCDCIAEPPLPPNAMACAVELDWLRTLWDVHTNYGSGVDPSFTYILTTWLGGADAWDRDNVYDMLDARASALSGNLDNAWDAAKGANAVDHPAP